MIGLAGVAVANAYTMTNGNSTINYDPDTSAGMSDWKIDGQDQLAKQWFWYRVGTTGGESAINTIGHVTTQSSPGNRLIETVFTSASNFRITVTYLLTGGAAGSQTGDIAETIKIESLKTSGTLDFHFFQYSDFDLQGTANNDIGKFISGGRIAQSDATTGLTLSETIATPMANHYELNTAAALQAKLTDGLTTTLSDTPAVGDTYGATNVAWAFQWDFSIAAGGSQIISKDKLISYTPVPDAGSTLALLGAALTGLAFVGRRFVRR